MMLEKLLVATDFSEESDAAVRQALRVSRRTGAELVLVHVSELPLPDPSHVLCPELAALEKAAEVHLADVRRRLDDVLEHTKGQGPKVSKVFTEGYPDDRIVDVARELRADLVVVGTHGRTGVRRLVLGSVAERVVRLAQTNVMVARREAAPTPTDGFRHVLVPTDFSDPADGALALAVSLAAPDGLVEIFHALFSPFLVGYPDYFGGSSVDIERWRVAARGDAEGRMQRLIARLGRSGVRLTGQVVEGGATPEIQRRLESDRYDLVVMGTHGRRGLRRGLLGSVAAATVRHAPCSVITVRAPTR
jgi:nucleotide-binding universal stress UspA family protein